MYTQHTYIYKFTCARAHTHVHNVTHATTNNTKITKSTKTKSAKTKTKSDHSNKINAN